MIMREWLTELQVRYAQPVAHWCGRFVAMNDRLRNKRAIDRGDLLDEEYETPREKRERAGEIMKQLFALCATNQARQSLQVCARSEMVCRQQMN